MIQIVDGHPLAARLTSEATQLVIDEVVPQVMTAATTAFIAFLWDQKHHEIMQVMNVNTFHEELLNNVEVVDLLQESANNVVRLSTGMC